MAFRVTFATKITILTNTVQIKAWGLQPVVSDAMLVLSEKLLMTFTPPKYLAHEDVGCRVS
jgi:hypothetical protein